MVVGAFTHPAIGIIVFAAAIALGARSFSSDARASKEANDIVLSSHNKVVSSLENTSQRQAIKKIEESLSRLGEYRKLYDEHARGKQKYIESVDIYNKYVKEHNSIVDIREAKKGNYEKNVEGAIGEFFRTWVAVETAARMELGENNSETIYALFREALKTTPINADLRYLHAVATSTRADWQAYRSHPALKQTLPMFAQPPELVLPPLPPRPPEPDDGWALGGRFSLLLNGPRGEYLTPEEWVAGQYRTIAVLRAEDEEFHGHDRRRYSDMNKGRK